MCAAKTDVKPNVIISIAQNKCPRCRRGKLYKHSNVYDLRNFMKMNETCPVCGQLFDMEPGFYYGTNMVSYALAVLFSILTFVLWLLTIGFSFDDSRFFWWIATNAVLLIGLQPPLMRLSRTVWIYFFVKYSSNWAQGDVIVPERLNKDQQHNW